jgi:branched-subunit amino acid ABC-type transport system permease component
VFVTATFLGIDSFREFAQSLVTGVINGAGYALLGVSFAFILSVTTRFHFAAVFTYTFCAYVAALIVGGTGVPLVPAAIVGVICSIVIAVAIEAVVYQPLARRAGSDSLLPIFVASLGIVIAGENVIRLIWGNNTRDLGGFPRHTYSVGNVDFSLLDVTGVAVAIVIPIALALVLARTVLGQQIRAVRGNPEMALAVGVSVRRIYVLVFAIGTLVAGIAALFDGMTYSVTPDMGNTPIFYGFVVAFLAGVAQSPIRVAIVGLVIGVVESVSTLWVSENLSALTVFGLLFIFLAARSVPAAIRQVSGALTRASRLGGTGRAVSRA